MRYAYRLVLFSSARDSLREVATTDIPERRQILSYYLVYFGQLYQECTCAYLYKEIDSELN